MSNHKIQPEAEPSIDNEISDRELLRELAQMNLQLGRLLLNTVNSGLQLHASYPSQTRTDTEVQGQIHDIRWDNHQIRDDKEYRDDWKTLKLKDDLYLEHYDFVTFEDRIYFNYLKSRGGRRMVPGDAERCSTMGELSSKVQKCFPNA